MPKKYLITPPHHDYPSHPEEPRLLIPPPEHRARRDLVPVIWDPNRPCSPKVEAHAPAVPRQTQSNPDVQSSHCSVIPSIAKNDAANYLWKEVPQMVSFAEINRSDIIPNEDGSIEAMRACVHRLDHSGYYIQGPEFIQPERCAGHHSSLAALQLMMYLKHPCFLPPIPSPEPMSCYLEYEEALSVGTVESALNNVYDFELEVPYSNDAFKHASGRC
ncbi:hypothetical protein ACHAW6_015055 [Cyclotella cf. meneghiniana]